MPVPPADVTPESRAKQEKKREKIDKNFVFFIQVSEWVS